MNYLQKLFEEQLHEVFSYPDLLIRVITKKFEENDIHLTSEQQAQFKVFFENYKSCENSDALFININDDGKVTFQREGGATDIIIDLTGTADEQISHLLDCLPELLDKVAEDTAELMLESFKKTAVKSISEDKELQGQFQLRLIETWQEPLHLLEIMTAISEGVGNEYNTYIRQTKDNDNHEPKKFEVLSRLHARSCQVAKEILLLLSNGFADGAHARWRTLHEISVIASFIKDHDDLLAEQYLLHDVIERFNEAVLYQEYCKELQYPAIPQKEFARIEKLADELVYKYGNVFTGDYGWAAQVLNKKRPTFSDIEKSVRMDHIRPYYRLACMNVHAGPHGVLFRLGVDEKQMDEILLSGSSNLGLADPGQNSAYSLLMATVSFLLYRPTLDCLVAIKALYKLEIEIFDAFCKVDNYVYQRTQKEIIKRKKR